MSIEKNKRSKSVEAILGTTSGLATLEDPNETFKRLAPQIVISEIKAEETNLLVQKRLKEPQNEKENETMKIGESGSPSSSGVKINLMLNINFNLKGNKVKKVVLLYNLILIGADHIK